MTPKQALEQLKEIQNNQDDTEVDHAEADRILCELLRALGYNAIVDAWESIDKWYA